MKELIQLSHNTYKNRTQKSLPIDQRMIAIKGPRPFGHTTMAIEALRFFSATGRVIYVAPNAQQLREHRKDYAGLLSQVIVTSFGTFEADLKGALVPGMEYVVVVDAGSLVPDGFYDKVEKTKIDAFYVVLG
jgi:hypothetical protein